MSKTKRIAVVLSGCGRMDGSEIHEATMLLLAIDAADHKYQCFAPNVMQSKVNNHITGEISAVAGDRCNREVMVESGRIARGNIKDLREFRAEEFDAIIFPGGMGAVSNWCNYDVKGVDCHVILEIEVALSNAYNEGIVIGAMCIAPVLIAKVLGNKGITLTIGNDNKTADDIRKMGAKHMDTLETGVCVDKEHKIVTTPAYMLCKSIKDVHIGAENLVEAMLKLM